MTPLKSMMTCQVTPNEQLPLPECLIKAPKNTNHKGGAYISIQFNLAHSQLTTHCSYNRNKLYLFINKTMDCNDFGMALFNIVDIREYN